MSLSLEVIFNSVSKATLESRPNYASHPPTKLIMRKSCAFWTKGRNERRGRGRRRIRNRKGEQELLLSERKESSLKKAKSS